MKEVKETVRRRTNEKKVLDVERKCTDHRNGNAEHVSSADTLTWHFDVTRSGTYTWNEKVVDKH